MTVRVTTFRNDGLVFDVRDSGPDDGPVVVLLHGFPQNGQCWELVEPLLHDAGYRTLAPDLRGYSPGASPNRVADYRLRLMTADVLALADAAGAERFHVVGHDWGGALAWEVAGSQPSRVQTLTSLSTPHPAAMAHAVRASREQALASWYMLAFQVPWAAERLMTQAERGMAKELGPELSARYLASRKAVDWRGPLNWYRANSPFARGAADVGRVTPPCPVNATFVWGSHDPYLRRQAALEVGEHVKGDYESVELDAGHWLPEKEPVACAQAILRRLGTGL